jgi:hypothetical protein
MDLVVLRTFMNGFAALIAQSALEAAGITSMLRSDDCGGLQPQLWMRGVDLLVREDDQARAVEVLDRLPQSVEDPAEEADL